MPDPQRENTQTERIAVGYGLVVDLALKRGG